MVKLPLKGGPKRRCVRCRLSVPLVFIVALHPYIRCAPAKCCVGREKKVKNPFDSVGGRMWDGPFNSGGGREAAGRMLIRRIEKMGERLFFEVFQNSLLLPLTIIPQVTDANQHLFSSSRKIVLEAGFQPSRSPKTGQFPVFHEPGPKGPTPPGFPLDNKGWYGTGGPQKTRK
jgi:hypothetical protein